MEMPFERLSLQVGSQNLEKIKKSNILVFGCGGVGGYVIEGLIRSGVESITIVDGDNVCISNINRQIIALLDTVSKPKVEVMKDRILSINKNVSVHTINLFALKENIPNFNFSQYDYVIDCIDTISTKIAIIEEATRLNVKIISAMGAGNKINPSMLLIDDIYKTKVDPLAKVMRHELKKRRIKKLKVAYSIEKPLEVELKINPESKKPIPSSSIFVPASMGLLIASEVIKDITGIRNDHKGV